MKKSHPQQNNHQKQKLVRVYWRDISTLDSPHSTVSWFTREQALKRADEVYNALCTSIGEIIAENDKFIVIASTTADSTDVEDPLYTDASMIMKSVITRIEKLNN